MDTSYTNSNEVDICLAAQWGYKDGDGYKQEEEGGRGQLEGAEVLQHGP